MIENTIAVLILSAVFCVALALLLLIVKVFFFM